VARNWSFFSLQKPNPDPTNNYNGLARTGYGNMDTDIKKREIMPMARKKKIKRFRAVQLVKEMAREQIGAPPVEKVVPNKKRKLEKHKPTLEKLIEDPD
jgi:hypothetical protein